MSRFLCLIFLPSLLGAPLAAEDWPQWMGTNRDGVWREAGLVERFPEGGPRVVWRTPAGAGYAGPAVADGRVFVMEREGRPTADTSKGLEGVERLRALDAATGATVWKREWEAPYLIDYATGPRATPTVHDGLVYALGAEGKLVCVRAADGTPVWERDLKTDFQCSSPTWGFAGHPLVWKDLLLCLVGGQGTTAVALDRRTGAEQWRALSSSQAGYSPPTLIRNHGRDEVIYWHGEAINSLDPATGKVHWTMPKSTRFGVSMAMPRQVGNDLLVSAFWWGSRMMRLREDQSEPEILWETERESDTRTEHLNALMCTPLHHDGFLYGVCSYGQLRCLDWSSGARKWETFAATTGAAEERWGTAFLTRLAGPGEDGHRFLVFNEKGELILARLTPDAYEEISRAKIVEADCPAVKDRPVVWTHPAYAGRRAFIKNNSEIVCVELGREDRAAGNADRLSPPLMEFAGAAGEPEWVAVNDGVMGGLSQGGARIKDGVLHFTGSLSLENNGGFSSVRTKPLQRDLSAATHLTLRVHGDGRVYQLRLSTDARFRGSRISYGAEFATKAGEWIEVKVPCASLTPSHHGDALDGPPLDLAKVEEIGLLIADKREGAFALKVDWIKAE